MLVTTRSARMVVIALCTGVLHGCAGLIVPQVDPQLPAKSSPPITRAAAKADFTQARTYVNDLRVDIIRKRDQHAAAQWGYLGAVLAMVTTITGLGATGTTGAPIIALGLASAATTTAGTTVPIQERITVYNVALEALDCIEAATGAFDLSPTREEMLKGRAYGDPARPTLDELSVELRGWRDQLSFIPTPTDELKALATAVDKALVTVAETQSAAQSIFASKGAVAAILTDNASTLATRMNQALSERDPNLRSSLYALVPNAGDIIRGVGAGSGKAPKAAAPAPLSSGPAFAPPPPPDPGAIRATLAQVDLAVTTAKAVIAKFTTDPDAPVKSCMDKVRDAFAKRPMTVIASDGTAIAPGEDTTMVVDAGTRPYFVDLIGSAATNLSKSERDLATGSHSVTLTALAAAKSDSYTVNIRDSSTPPQVISQVITVTAAPAGLSTTLVSTKKPPIKKDDDPLLYRISGGDGKYEAAAATGAPVTVTMPGPDLVQIIAKDVSGDTEASVNVKDGANHTTQIKVLVNKK